MNERHLYPVLAYEMQHVRHLPDADFALIRKPPEHNRGLVSTRMAICKREVTTTMPALMS